MKDKFTVHNYMFVLFALVLLTLVTFTYSKVDHGVILHNSSSKITEDSNNKPHPKGLIAGKELGRELYPMGSSLPDCTHACGVCSPCKRAMVSFQCASESCPVVYRCLCNGKYYHVPSSK